MHDLTPPKWQDVLRLARQLAYEGKYAESLKTLEHVAARESDNISARAWLAFTRATIALRFKPISECELEIIAALQQPLAPKAKAQLRWNLICHYIKSNKPDLAAEQLAPFCAEESDPVLLSEALNLCSTLKVQSAASQLGPLTAPDGATAAIETLADWRLAFTIEGYGHLPPCFSETALSLHSPTVRGAILDNTRIVWHDGAIFILGANGEIILDFSTRYPINRAKEVIDRALLATPAVQVDEPVALLADRFVKANYCHWTLDWMPRIHLAHKVDPSVSRFVTYQQPAQHEAAVLDVFGIKGARFTCLKDSPVLALRRLVVSSNSTHGHRHPTQYGHPELLNWIDERVRHLVDGPGAGGKIFVRRLGARSVINEDEVLRLLEQHGFKAIDPGACSVPEQVRIFSAAKTVVGIHGAGLTNLVYSKSGTNVLEIFGRYGGSATYAVLARAKGMRYRYFRGEGEVTGAETKVRVNDAPMSINVSLLEQALVDFERAS